MNAFLNKRSAAYLKTINAIRSAQTLADISKLKCFKIFKNAQEPSDQFIKLMIAHKSSFNIKDRVKVYECINCNTVNFTASCGCRLKH